MEPDVASFHSSSPPPLKDGGEQEEEEEEAEEEAGSSEQDEEFGDFGGLSVAACRSHPVYPDPTDSPPSLRRPRATSKPAARQPSGGVNLPVEQAQPRCTVDRNAASRVRLTNGFFGGEPGSGAHSAVGACSPREETGFADFTVFAEQAAHPWCCGFSPAGGKERWDPRGRRSTSSSAGPIGGPVCTKVEHCEKRAAALGRPPQEALDFPLKELLGAGGDGRDGFSSPHSAEMDGGRETSIAALYESASEDAASLSDDLSFECPSADLEPNVSSLVSQEDRSDWDQTDEDGDELEDDGRRDSPGSAAPLRQSEAVRGFHHCDTSATQETCATSTRPPSPDCGPERRGDAGCLGAAGNLPLSDSFADFCSAPTREDEERPWAAFNDHGALEENPGTRPGEPVGILQDREGVSGSNRCQASLSCRVHQLLLDSFPEVDVPAVVGEEEVLALCALLHAQLLPVEEEEKIPEFCPTSQWTRRGFWRPHQDLHDAVGLGFQWGGSHTHRTLLRCLGVQTRNIVFISTKKEPVAEPAFASSLGLLEPTKDCPSPAGGSSPAPQETSTDPTQEELPSSQLGCSINRSALNMDYFGPEEKSTTSNSPPPGVDRQLEPGGLVQDTSDPLDRLMSTTEPTSTSVRGPQQDEQELSQEALALIAALPSLSFMQARGRPPAQTSRPGSIQGK
ncbi:aftph [Pungitius sinensis]